MYVRVRKADNEYVYDPSSDVAFWGFVDDIREDLEEGVKFRCYTRKGVVTCVGMGGARVYNAYAIRCMDFGGNEVVVNKVPSRPVRGVVCRRKGYYGSVELKLPRCVGGMCVYVCDQVCRLAYFGDDVYELFDRAVLLATRRVPETSYVVVV